MQGCQIGNKREWFQFWILKFYVVGFRKCLDKGGNVIDLIVFEVVRVIILCKMIDIWWNVGVVFVYFIYCVGLWFGMIWN